MPDERPPAAPRPPGAVSREVLGRRVRFGPEVLIQQVGGEAVLLDLRSEQYFGLDPVGTRLLALINESDSVAAALDRLLQEYEVERATLEEDALALLADCTAQGLLVIDAP